MKKAKFLSVSTAQSNQLSKLWFDYWRRTEPARMRRDKALKAAGVVDMSRPQSEQQATFVAQILAWGVFDRATAKMGVDYDTTLERILEEFKKENEKNDRKT